MQNSFMKDFKKWAVFCCILGLVSLAFLAVSDIAVDRIISKHPSGEFVASMGSGLTLLKDSGPWQPPDFEKHRYTFNTIEYRDSQGKTRVRYKPRWAPNDFAYVEWTDEYVVISSGMNGECPDFRVFERLTGRELNHASPEVLNLPKKILNGFDPCGWGQLENKKPVNDDEYHQGQ